MARNLCWKVVDLSISEFFTGYYDPNKDEITGCRKDSLVWFHEFRHSQQFKHPIARYWFFAETIIIRIFGTSFVLMAIFDNVNFFDWIMLAGLSLVPSTISSMVMELDAWIFGYIYWVRHLKDEPKV